MHIYFKKTIFFLGSKKMCHTQASTNLGGDVRKENFLRMYCHNSFIYMPIDMKLGR